jgi:hypothetical protein
MKFQRIKNFIILKNLTTKLFNDLIRIGLDLNIL